MDNPTIIGPAQRRKIEVKHPAGVAIEMLMDAETGGSEKLSMNISRVKPGVTLRPAHSHAGIEELVYVQAGKGEIWIEGKTAPITAGDVVLYPADSMHTVTNTGTKELSLLCVFSTASYRKPGAYRTHEDVDV